MASSRTPHILILEPDARGHVREWLFHLIEEAGRASRPVRLNLAVPGDLADDLRASLPASARPVTDIIALTPRETGLCLHRRLWVSGMARWWVMRRHLSRSGASRGLFLALDHLSLPLALGLGARGRRLSGILFRPSVHYAAIGPYRPTFRERVRDLRKSLLYRLMLRNPAVDAVFSLDPYFVDHARRSYPHAEKVFDTPDPVYPAPEPSGTDAALAGSVPQGKRLFLLFGELTERKGILVLLDALKLLSADDAAGIAVMAAGRIDPPVRDAVRRAVADIRRDRPELWLKLEDRRLTTGEISALLRRSHTVLAPYQRFVGSSGILLWAAQAGRPVLCQDYGLMGRLVRDHGLGLTSDTTDAVKLAEQIRLLAHAADRPSGDVRKMADLCAARAPGRFARIILDRACLGAHSAVPEPARKGIGDGVLD